MVSFAVTGDAGRRGGQRPLRNPARPDRGRARRAVREALADASIEWKDIQFAFGGSSVAGNAKAMLPRLDLTGVQFINVVYGCATGGSALLSGYCAIKSGEFDLVVVLGFDKHPRGASDPEPEAWGLPKWYGETGMMLATKFFAMKIQRYMALHGITPLTLARWRRRHSRTALG